jgi:hypothetical protein
MKLTESIHYGIQHPSLLTCWSLSVSLRTTRFNIHQFYTALALRWVFCTDLRTESGPLLYTLLTDWFLLTVVESVYSAVRTDSLFKADYVSYFKGEESQNTTKISNVNQIRKHQVGRSFRILNMFWTSRNNIISGGRVAFQVAGRPHSLRRGSGLILRHSVWDMWWTVWDMWWTKGRPTGTCFSPCL